MKAVPIMLVGYAYHIHGEKPPMYISNVALQYIPLCRYTGGYHTDTATLEINKMHTARYPVLWNVFYAVYTLLFQYTVVYQPNGGQSFGICQANGALWIHLFVCWELTRAEQTWRTR